MRYGDWIQWIFDREVSSDSDLYPGAGRLDRTTSVAHFTQLMTRCGTDLQPFSDAQVNQGLRYVFSFESTFVVNIRRGGRALLTERTRAIQSIEVLYADCFSTRCTRTMSHLNEPGSRLNLICYMLWEISGLAVRPSPRHRADLYHAALNVIRAALDMDHPACVESALHALGHLRCQDSKRVGRIVDSFLKRSPTINPALRVYAERARNGLVQ